MPFFNTLLLQIVEIVPSIEVGHLAGKIPNGYELFFSFFMSRDRTGTGVPGLRAGFPRVQVSGKGAEMKK